MVSHAPVILSRWLIANAPSSSLHCGMICQQPFFTHQKRWRRYAACVMM